MGSIYARKRILLNDGRKKIRVSEEIYLEYRHSVLLEADGDFKSGDCTAADAMIKAHLMEKLEEALHALAIEEIELVQEGFYLYFDK